MPTSPAHALTTVDIYRECKKVEKACIAACKKRDTEDFDYKVGMYCEDRIREGEAKQMKGAVACSKNLCVVRLKETSDLVYEGNGIGFVGTIGSGQTDFVLTDRKKRKTYFWEGGTANTMNYEKGPWKSAEFTRTKSGYLVKVPKREGGF
jgi:hypothetical protein